MLFVDRELRHFFAHNEKNLKDQYPGLRYPRLKDEVEYFLSHGLDDAARVNLLQSFLSSLKKGIPLEYITKRAFFYRSEFYVDDRVLIPRSETEILVEMAAEYLKHSRLENPRLIDIGCGSGNILLSLLQEWGKKSEAIFSDLSDKALSVAQQNVFLLRHSFHPNTQIKFQKQDRLISNQEQFDLIVSNPPYIMKDQLVHAQVLEFEPRMALFLDNEKYDPWFSQFFEQIKAGLKPQGLALIEGHEDHLERLKTLAQEKSFEVKLEFDLTRRPRFLRLNHKE